MDDLAFVGSVLSCVSIDMDWPDINMPGFPSICWGCFGSMFAGINLILPFIPPDIDGLPDFTLPDINIFIDAFFTGITLPSFPAITINLPGVSIPLPAFSGIDLPDSPSFDWWDGLSFDPLSMCKFISIMIGLPFLLIKFILDSIFDLNLQLPDFDYIFDLIFDLCLSAEINFPIPTIELFAGCLATTLSLMIVELIG